MSTPTADSVIVSAGPVYLGRGPTSVASLTFMGPASGTVNLPYAGTITNTSGAASGPWSITPPAGLSVTPNSGSSIAAGATVNLSFQASNPGSYQTSLVCAGANVIGNPQAFSAAAAGDPVVSLGKYRTTTSQLFADVLASTATTGDISNPINTPARAGVAAPAAGYEWGAVGPSANYVETAAKWAWANQNGDWINTLGVAQSTSSPHAACIANNVPSGSAPYTFNATAGAQAAFARGKWNAYIVVPAGSGLRAVAAIHHPSLAAPVMNVTYAAGGGATLKCVACVRLTTGTSYTQIGAAEQVVNATLALEFEMPTAAVASATITWNITSHDAQACTLNCFLANPPVNTAPVVEGIAASYPLDAGISAHASVKFAQNFADGSVLSDWVIPYASTAALDYYSKAIWSPGVLGGTADPTKLPTAFSGVPIAASGKWFHKQNSTPNISLVNSSYTGENFVPRAQGMGALRIVIPGNTSADGANTGGGGALGCDLLWLLPENIIGTLTAGYVRYCIRFALVPRTLAATKMFRTSPGGTANYTVQTGKFGIGWHHLTHGAEWDGGINNDGGENLGWSDRGGITATPADCPVPGLRLFRHSQDMRPARVNLPFGKDGGMGAGFRPDTWYDLETFLQLNDYNPAGAIGSNPSNGVAREYIDGRLDSTHTGLNFRDGAIDYARTPNGPSLPPFSPLGFKGLWLNHFEGGSIPPDHDLVAFITGIVAGTSYVGPLKDPVQPIQLSGINYTPRRDGSGNVLASDISQLPVLNKWYEVMPVTGFPSRISQTKFGPTLQKPNASDDHAATVDNWCAAIFEPTRQWVIGGGAGHNGSSAAQITLNGVDCPKLLARVFSPPNTAANVLVHTIFGDHASDLKFVSPPGPSSEEFPPNYSNPTYDPNAPGRGTVGATHTYWGLEYIPPALANLSGLPGSTLGGLFWRGTASTIFSIDGMAAQTAPGDYVPHTKVHWRRVGGSGVIADSYVVTMLIENVVYATYQSAVYTARFQIDATEVTDWQTAINPATGLLYDPQPGVPSQIKQLLNFTPSTTAKLIPYATQVPCKMYGRGNGGELAMIAPSGQSLRIRWGDLHAAIKAGTFTGAQSLDGYIDNITLTSSDGSHTELGTPSKYAAFQTFTAQQPWDGAGAVYESGEDAIYLYPSAAGSRVIKVTGLSGATWTTQYIANSELPADNLNGVYGRAQHFTIGSKKYAIWIAYDHTYVARLN